ncbi:MAG: hypothetical protein DMG76_28720 [Acidobacteria bacterium]|nr:MAG: hypothetical protein DMG76_28720 [Acidobacteriota bacterium]
MRLMEAALAASRPTIAHVTPWYLPHIGGLERHVETISKGLPKFSFRIITPRIPDTDQSETVSENVFVRRYGPVRFPPEPQAKRSSAMRDWIDRFARFLNLRSELKGTTFDILHVHRPPMIELAYLAAKWGNPIALRLLARRLNQLPARGRPRILTDHGLFVMPSTPSPLDIRWFMSWVLEDFDHVICVDRSGFERARSIQTSNPSASSQALIHHIPQPMDTEVFRLTPMPSSSNLIVGYSGRWERDGMFLLRELVDMELPRVRFVISGGATNRDLDEYRDSFSRGSVELRPNLLESEQLARFYADIHVLVDFYRGDGCGRSVLEAMACGRPVLRTRARDTHPVIDRQTGFLEDAGAEAFATKLGQLVDQKGTLTEIGLRARQIVEEEYGLPAVLGKLEKIYRSCLRNPPG